MILDTKLGKIKGEFYNNQYVFKGIPYVEAIVKENRFKKAIKKEKWSGILDATEYGKMSIQNIDENNKNKISENCLTLNIWSESLENKKAVVVWIHGGGFTSGFSSDDNINGENFANDDIVYVSVNYRLGILGFLDCSEEFGDDYKYSCNNGILDIIEALKWIKDNIQYFGGDEENITLMGESAGAKAISGILLSPLAKGLFHKVILESGSYQSIREKKTSKKITEKVKDILKEKGKDLSYLKSCFIYEILEIQNKLAQNPLGLIHMFGSTVDKEVLLYNVNENIEKKIGSIVPILIGVNSEESNIFLEGNLELVQRNELLLKDMFGENYTEVLNDFYKIKEIKGKCESELWRDILTKYQYFIHSYRLGNKFSNLTDVYFYIFDWKGKIGACHVQELPFVYNKTTKSDYIWDISAEDMKLGYIMNLYWKSFIKNSNPNNEELINWPKYDTDKKQIMCFDKNIEIFNLKNFKDNDKFPNNILIL